MKRIAGSVLIVGVGGLGCPAGLVLARTGVSHLGLADGDRVDASNLHRQLLYTSADIGRNKAEVAAARLHELASGPISISVHPARVTASEVATLFSSHDFIIDATDDPASKFLLNDAAVLFGKPLSHAGVVGFEGQLLTVLPRRSTCLRCLFPDPPADGEVATCRESGILGPLPSMIGALQAHEALRTLCGRSPLFVDRLLSFDARGLRFREVPLRRSAACPLCGPKPRIRHIFAEPTCEEIP